MQKYFYGTNLLAGAGIHVRNVRSTGEELRVQTTRCDTGESVREKETLWFGRLLLGQESHHSIRVASCIGRDLRFEWFFDSGGISSPALMCDVTCTDHVLTCDVTCQDPGLAFSGLRHSEWLLDGQAWPPKARC